MMFALRKAVYIVIFIVFCQFTIVNGQVSCDTVCTEECSCDELENTGEIIVVCDGVTTAGKPFLSCFGSNVTEIKIHASDIVELTLDDFATMTNLTVFTLENSPLMNITQDALSSSLKLQQFHIRNTSLSYIHNETFADLPELHVLDLSGNAFVELNSAMLEGASSLLTMLISNNNISFLPKELFTDCSGLMTLHVSKNDLNSIDSEVLLPLANLIDLDLSINYIESIDANAFFNLTSLDWLKLHDNLLTGLPLDLFAQTQELRYLDLSSNVLTGHIAMAFENNTALEELDISNNLITTIPAGSFLGLNGITHLNLSRNGILETIDEEAFTDLTSLESLDLSENQNLIELPVNVFPSDSLVVLNEIYLQNCGLASLNYETFSELPTLTHVPAYGNPFYCDCDVSWISQMQDAPEKWMESWITGPTALVCGLPPNLNGSLIVSFDEEDLTCDLPLIDHQDEFMETNGNKYYYAVLVSRGFPSTYWTLPDGSTVLGAGDTYKPPSGKDIVHVEETQQQNKSIRSLLTITDATKASEGTYLLTVSNAGGIVKEDIVITIPDAPIKDKRKIIGGIVGGLLGGIIIIIILGIVVDYYKKRRGAAPYNRMSEPSGTEGNRIVTAHDAASYGGVADDVNSVQNTEAPQKV